MTITRYKKREPIEVEAVRLTLMNLADAAQWCGGQLVNSGNLVDGEVVMGQPVGIKLRTKNRLQVALLGDYIYKDHEDYFHVKHVVEFLFEYEPLKGDEDVVAEPKENHP